jgi:hypothetical protein
VNSDTLQIDSAQIAVWQSDSRFDYDRELVGGSENLLQWLVRNVTDWLKEQLGVMIGSDVAYYSLLVVGGLALGFIAYLVWRRRSPSFMRRSSDAALDYELEEDTIYDVDFTAALAAAEQHGDWRQVVRLLYLQTLRLLNDAGRIDWQPSKTPAQYVREVGEQSFTDLSHHFVRIRYGNFEATEAVCQTMKGLQAQLKRSLQEETARQAVSQDASTQKGGQA